MSLEDFPLSLAKADKCFVTKIPKLLVTLIIFLLRRPYITQNRKCFVLKLFLTGMNALFSVSAS